jgi:hypothetical protein
MRVNEWLPAAKYLRELFPFVAVPQRERVSIVVSGVAFAGVSTMKTRENLVRLKQFQVNDKRRQVLQLDMMIAEFERMANELDVQILAEEKKAGITDVNHFAYPTFAKAARQRRDNLKNSQHDLLQQRSMAEAHLAEAEAELSKAEALESRDARSRDTDNDIRSAMIG